MATREEQLKLKKLYLDIYKKLCKDCRHRINAHKNRPLYQCVCVDCKPMVMDKIKDFDIKEGA